MFGLSAVCAWAKCFTHFDHIKAFVNLGDTNEDPYHRSSCCC